MQDVRKRTFKKSKAGRKKEIIKNKGRNQNRIYTYIEYVHIAKNCFLGEKKKTTLARLSKKIENTHIHTTVSRKRWYYE